MASQKPEMMGREVMRAKKMVVFRPPPTFHEKYQGTPIRREKRAALEKASVPAASAGRGAFLMVGYWRRIRTR